MTKQSGQTDGPSPHKDLDDLSKRVQQMRKETGLEDTPQQDGVSPMAIGLKYATEFSAAVLVGAFLGYGFDHFLATSPWGLITGLFLGLAAGTREIIRSAKKDIDNP